jgi:hypothetical protein
MEERMPHLSDTFALCLAREMLEDKLNGLREVISSQETVGLKLQRKNCMWIHSMNLWFARFSHYVRALVYQVINVYS